MKIDLTSFFFNSSIEGGTANTAWSTSVGKSNQDTRVINTRNKIGLSELIAGMNCNIRIDRDNLDIARMTRNRDLLYFSFFDKVFVNNEAINGGFTLLFVKEHTVSHEGRLSISYPHYAKYNDTLNSDTMNEMSRELNCENGCWFVYDISIENFDELHFKAIIVDSTDEITYSSSLERKNIWTALVNDLNEGVTEPINLNNQIQKIYYGAPGTGKSHIVKQITEVPEKEKRVERITFHPEYDYSSFVGGYKPTMNGNDIRYEFVPQAFTKIYVDSWNDLDNDYYLVIEEINRGNCAEIFGDIFQILDRTNDYKITPSKELREYLESQFVENNYIDSDKLLLPPNLNILATMNTSDQSLFPMDSAFKRRWDWEYIPINYSRDEEQNPSALFEVKLSEERSFKWIEFIEKVNEKISSNDNLGMDKCLGNYFIKPEQGEKTISIKSFINKAIFYLWNDVFKDEMEDESIFKDRITYENFFPIENNGLYHVQKIVEEILGVDIIESSSTDI